MWCQKCNKYYDTDAETCEKCGEKLIDYTPIVEDDREDVLFMSNLSPDEPEEQKTEVKTAEAAPLFDGEPKLLITVIGSGEADRITEMLEQNKIPSMKKEAEVHTSTEECDNDFDPEELEALDGEEQDEDYAAEFSALCDEALEGEELYDIFVPAGCFSEGLMLVIEDEQGDSVGDEASDEESDAERDFSDKEESEPEQPSSEEKNGLFGLFKRKKK